MSHSVKPRVKQRVQPTPLELVFACPSCGEAIDTPIDATTTSAICPHCEAETTLPEAAETVSSSPVAPCPVCGSEDLYSHRDFNRKAGITIVVIGSVLGPFTSWISVIIAVIIDFLLYLFCNQVAVCYACNAQFRGFTKDAKPGEFDIAVHDAYKFAKRFPPRRDRCAAGPKAKHELWTGGPRPGPDTPRESKDD